MYVIKPHSFIAGNVATYDPSSKRLVDSGVQVGASGGGGDGPRGFQGPHGTSGSNGFQGPHGTSGTNGSNGFQGPHGATSGLVEVFKFSLDNTGSVLTTSNAKARVIIPYACTISTWEIIADQTGSVQYDVKRATFSTYPTLTSIVGTGTKPALSSAQKLEAAPSGWTSIVFAAGDVVEFSLLSASAITFADLVLKVTRN